MPATNIVTPNEVKTYASASSELDIATIKPWMITNAQENHLKFLLGQDLYYDVMLNPSNYVSLISGCDYTFSGYNRIYKGLKYYVSNMVMYEAAPYIYTSLSKSGFHHKNVELSNNATPEDVEKLKHVYFSQALIEAENIVQYINENINTYQLFSGRINGTMNGGIFNPNANTGGLTDRMRNGFFKPRD